MIRDYCLHYYTYHKKGQLQHLFFDELKLLNQKCGIGWDTSLKTYTEVIPELKCCYLYPEMRENSSETYTIG